MRRASSKMYEAFESTRACIWTVPQWTVFKRTSHLHSSCLLRQLSKLVIVWSRILSMYARHEGCVNVRRQLRFNHRLRAQEMANANVAWWHLPERYISNWRVRKATRRSRAYQCRPSVTRPQPMTVKSGLPSREVSLVSIQRGDTKSWNTMGSESTSTAMSCTYATPR